MEASHPTSIDDVLAMLDGPEPPTLLAGGTDLMVETNFGHARPERVVGLRRVKELKSWEDGRIGAGITWRQVEREGPKGYAEAARTIGSPQIRNAGTIGGNLGTASPAGDGHPFLAAVDAGIELQSVRGRRTLPWNRFFTGVKKTARRTHELITAVHLPASLPPAQAFGKIGVRNAMVIATVCAVVTRDHSGVTRVALGSVGPTPVRAARAEQWISAVEVPGPDDLTEFAGLVSEEVSPITDHRSTEEYRRHAAGVLCRRLLERCLAQLREAS